MAIIENKILEYLDAIYELSDADKNKLEQILQKNSSEENKKILFVVYSSYLEFQKNADKLKQKLQNVSNALEEMKEQSQADEILLDLK